jgi:hypothetical protein
MEKAIIKILEGPNKNEILEVMYNPTEYESSVIANWDGEVQGSDEKIKKKRRSRNAMPSFGGSEFGSLTLKLLFDSYEQRSDVREDHEITQTGKVKKIIGTKRIVELGIPTVEGKEAKRPPLCLFSWGKFNFSGVIEKVDQKFIMFLSNGTPVRANVTITMRRIVTSKREMVKMMGREACRKFRVVKEGERLDILAEEELKDPSLWRKIAEANNIADPLNFPRPEDIGRLIIIPD